MSDWIDPDDAPELTAELAAVSELRVGGKVVRPATGYLGPNGVVRGRPPLGEHPKRQVTLRLDPEILDRFRAGGPGWQGRINEALRKAVGL
ncbi:BrnA antitoxin family protein [uncultured Sphingomonas sp.]|uniref:BrnA antitoxin family protein n=1 Tax=uncultured Sphingomonas sp. TaxID=158754 RepID=UPI0035C98332